MPMAHRHVVITGTGRAGTSFLVQLLTSLGLDTGFGPEESRQHLSNVARAGLEQELTSPDSPYIIKSPRFCDQAEAVLRRKDIIIEHVFVPMRDLEAAVESRRLVTREARCRWSPWRRFLKRVRGREGVSGGVFVTDEGLSQETVLLQRVYRLLWSLSNAHIPVTLLRYPRLVKDVDYLFCKLQPVLDGIGCERFQEAWQETTRPELMHCFNERDR